MYDEAGSGQRIQCLKYLVLANMLTESSINPFDSQETKPYKNDAQIEAMTALVSAFQRKEIREFERILKGTSRFSRGYAFDMHHVRRCFTPLPIALRKTDNSEAIMGDPFIRNYIEDVLKNIRTQVLLQMVQPYRTVNLDFLARSLGGSVSVEQVEQLLVGLILDEKLRGRVDQV